MMNRKLILLSIIVLATCFASGFATSAWFTSMVVSSDNVFLSGKLEIKGPDSPITTRMLGVDNIYPGWNEKSEVQITNTGTLNFNYRMYVEPDNLVGNILYDGATPLQISVLKDDKVVQDYINLNLLGYLNMETINEQNSDKLCILLRLPEEADDSYQGIDANISFVFEAKQNSNGAVYPENDENVSLKVKSINVEGQGGINRIEDSNGKLQMIAKIEPETAVDKRITWSVKDGSGSAVINNDGLLLPVADGDVIVKASALDGSGVEGTFNVNISNQVVGDAKNLADLESGLANPSVSSLCLSPGKYILPHGMVRNSSACNITIYCKDGSAEIKIDKDMVHGYGSKPINVTIGNGIILYENVIYAGQGKQFQTIQQAIGGASDNDTICVSAVSNREGITINKPLTLLGAKAGIPAFTESGGTVTAREVLGQESNICLTNGNGIIMTGKGTSNVTINGFCFEGLQGKGITADGEINNVVIENNLFKNVRDESIDFRDLKRNNLTIENNAFCGIETTGGDRTVVLLSGGNNINTVIDNNFIQSSSGYKLFINNSCGIDFDGGVNAYITNNIIRKVDKFAVQIARGGNNIYCSGNDIDGSFAGFKILTQAAYNISNIKISNNTISNIRNTAISVVRKTTNGGVGGLVIENNNINLLTSKLSTNSGAILVCLDPEYAGVHGIVKIHGNRIKFSGLSGPVSTAYGLTLMGKLGKVSIANNTFTNDGLNQGILVKNGIYIVKQDRDYGIIPDSCDIISSGNMITGFENKILDTR